MQDTSVFVKQFLISQLHSDESIGPPNNRFKIYGYADSIYNQIDYYFLLVKLSSKTFKFGIYNILFQNNEGIRSQYKLLHCGLYFLANVAVPLNYISPQ